MAEATGALHELEARMAEASVFGQWQIGANRPETARPGVGNRPTIEPTPAGKPHMWPWATMQPFLKDSLAALTESRTARRSLIFKNPELQRGTTHTMIVALQTIGPGEIAWAHRHTVTALRFVVEGSKKLYTVVDGEPLPMEPYDLVLTPGWCWHDHHNESDAPGIWLDVLDVPLMVMLNQSFYEELGEETQPRTMEPQEGSGLLRPAWKGAAAAHGAYRYPWADVRARLESLAATTPSPHDGIVLEYVNARTGGSALATIAAWVQMLPPGFSGEPHRHSASAAYFVIEGEGRTTCGDETFTWGRHDSVVVPNWSWHRHENLSKTEPALLFCINDTPLLRPFGLYREEPDNTLAGS